MVLRNPPLKESLLHSQQYTFGVKYRFVGVLIPFFFLFLFEKHTREQFLSCEPTNLFTLISTPFPPVMFLSSLRRVKFSREQ